MRLPRDENGIPIISAQEIEKLSDRFVAGTVPQVLSTPSYMPLPDVFANLQERKLCSFSSGDDLGFTVEGRPRLGRYSLTRRHIAISGMLNEDDPRYAFTCAHELGHFYLHSKISPAAVPNAEGEAEIWDSSRELMTYRIDGAESRSHVEWQANRFAAGILMPARTVGRALYRIQHESGIRGAGRIWLDHQRQNQQDYRNILIRLSRLYRVSSAVVEYRLRELQLIEVDPKYHMAPLNQVLRGALGRLFGE